MKPITPGNDSAGRVSNGSKGHIIILQPRDGATDSNNTASGEKKITQLW